MTLFKRNICLWLIVILLVYPLSAQVKLFTNDELPSEHVYQISQDHTGYIWILTEEGMVKYNGNKLKLFSRKNGLPTNTIWNLVETEDRLWYICKGNKQGYIKDDSVYTFTHKTSSFTSTDHFIKNNQLILKDVNENLCLAKDGQWQIIKNKKRTLNDLLIVSNHFTHIKFKNSKRGVQFYNNDSVLMDLDIALSPVYILKGFPKDILAFNTETELYFINTKTLKVTQTRLPKNLKIKMHHGSLRFINNQFQVSFMNFVGILDDSFQLSQSYQIDSKLKAHSNLIDKDGNIWTGSFETGVHFISSKSINSTVNKPLQMTYAPFIQDKKVYYLTKNGLYNTNSSEPLLTSKRYLYYGNKVNNTSIISGDIQYSLKNNKIKPFQLFKTLKHYRALNISYNKGIYYTVNHKEFCSFDSNYNTIKKIPFVAKNICFYHDTIFFLANDGLHYLDKGTAILKHPNNINLPLSGFSYYKDKLLLGSQSGIIIYNSGKTSTINLNGANVRHLKMYHDSLLFCASNLGLICLKTNGDSFIPYYNYTKSDGLLSNHCNGVEIDQYNNLYITTKKGIIKTKIVYPNEVKNSLNVIFLEQLNWGNKDIRAQNDLVFNFKPKNSLDVQFDCIHYDYKPTLNYSYRLSRDDDYTRLVELPDGRISLTDLPVGNYLLQLMVKKDFVAKNSKLIQFSIVPRWFQTTWFKLTCTLLFFLLLFLLITIRNKRKSKEIIESYKKISENANFKLEALRSQMNPHFVFNSLNAIQYYINENENELSEKYLLKFAKLVREFFDLSNEQDIALEREIILLKNYLGLEQMRFEKKLNHTITIDPKLNLKTSKIPCMLLQPIVENAVNHGVFHKEDLGEINIIFKYVSPNEYLVMISDDGIGIENSKILKEKSIQGHVSKSTFIFKERIELLNKIEHWDIKHRTETLTQDEKYPGTLVTLNIKYND